MRRNVLMILEMEGFKPLSAENGRKGLELARQEKPDLIVCDITMPEMKGSNLESGENGGRALNWPPKKNPDLFVCDTKRREMDGSGVFRALREKKETATLPFIFLTARGEKLDVRVGMNYGADDYLT